MYNTKILYEKVNSEIIKFNLSDNDDLIYFKQLTSLKQELKLLIGKGIYQIKIDSLTNYQAFGLVNDFLDNKLKIYGHESIKYYRLLKGYSYQTCAKLVGIPQHRYTRIESGEKLPTIPVAKKIAYVLGFDWWLIFDSVDMYIIDGDIFYLDERDY